MATDCIPQLRFEFHGIRQYVLAAFDAEHASSEGGALLLKGIDEKLRLTERLADCLVDPRQQGKIQHSYTELLRQRLFGIACGFEDANDSARLAADPVHKVLVDRDPIDGDRLAAQPTLSRFENAVDRKSLYRMAEEIAEVVIETQRRRRKGKARRITIDLDPTEDDTHGQQEFAFFNGHYRSWCYLPVIGMIRFNDEAEQHAVCAVLRPGNSPDARGAVAILSRLIARLREAFPGVEIHVRLDGGFGKPVVLNFLDEARVKYVVGFAKNKVLKAHAEPLMAEARARSEASGESEQVFGEVSYAAKSWPRERRVILKAEVVRLAGREPRDNLRLVITNYKLVPRNVYRAYRQRGDAENRIKELKCDLAMDRTSCSRFVANQFRVLLTLAAYVLYQQLRHHARGTSFARAQVGTLRAHLIKLGAWLQRSVRRIVVHLPVSYPWLDAWRTIARSVGAVPT